MRSDQLADARRGVDLLLAQLRGTAGSLDPASAEPLMTVATILVRMLRDATYGSVKDALALVRGHISTQISIRDVRSVEHLISDIVSGRQPRVVSTEMPIVAVVSQSIASGAVTELAKIQNKDVSSLMLDLKEKLESKGDELPLSDRDVANAVSEQHAADPNMRQARQAAAFAITHHWNNAANAVHQSATRNSNSSDAVDSLTALALLSVTCAALNGGIFQLAAQNNLYPAMSLLGQLVEAEFILWKFSKDAAHSSAWLHSTAEARRLHWRPPTIVRDDDNDYRQQDYERHCEMGGHPTPEGTRIAAGVSAFGPMASLFCDQINHSKDAWRHFVTAVDLIDQTHGTNVSTSLSNLNAAFQDTIREHAAVDQYGNATASSADSID